MKPTAIEKPGERNWDGKLGIHGKKCPHCFDGDCECCCEECRPDMWEDKKSDDLKPTVGWEDRFDECNIWQKWGDEIVTKEIKSFIRSLLKAQKTELIDKAHQWLIKELEGVDTDGKCNKTNSA